MDVMKNYLSQLLEACSQLVNALTGGYADEMLSARLHRQRHNPTINFLRQCINQIFFWQSDHCAQAYQCEWQRKGQHPHYSSWYCE